MEPYPKVTDIQAFNIISNNQAFYIFGGVFNKTLVANEILSFKNKTWSKVGILLSKRESFSVVLVIDQVYIVGGEKKQTSEVCKLSTTVSCEEDSTIDYKNFKQPVLFSVDLCTNYFLNYEPKEPKELLILSNKNFQEIDNFVKVQSTNYRTDKLLFFCLTFLFYEIQYKLKLRDRAIFVFKTISFLIVKLLLNLKTLIL